MNNNAITDFCSDIAWKYLSIANYAGVQPGRFIINNDLLMFNNFSFTELAGYYIGEENES